MIYLESDQEYDLGRGKEWVSPSDIKGLRVPKDFLIKRMTKPKAKDYFDVGTAFHAAILQPKKFSNLITYFPEENFPDQDKKNDDGTIPIRTKANKDAFAEFKQENEGKVVLRESDWNVITEMVMSYESHWPAKNMLQLKKGWAEHSFYARYVFNKAGKLERIEPARKEDKRDSDLVMLLRTKADFVHKERPFALDLKSTLNVHPPKFSKQASDLEYDIQAAMVLDIVNANIPDGPYETFIWVAMEKSPPYYVPMYDTLFQDIIDAQQIYLRRLSVIREAMNDNKWPGFEFLSNNDWGLLTLELPAWYKNQQFKSKF